MKKCLFLVYMFFAFSTVTNASFPIDDKITINEPCDNIILKNGDEISVKIIEITPDLIKYKKCGNLDGPLFSIYKNEVLLVRYKDGTKDIFNETNVNLFSNSNESDSSWMGIYSLVLSLIVFLIPLPIVLGILFAGISFISGLASLDDKNWGLGLAGMIIGLIDLIILLSVLAI